MLIIKLDEVNERKMQYNLQPLTGMVEFSPAEQLQFEQWKNKVAHIYALYGFTPIETTALERSEILLAKAGGETEKQIYRFTKGTTDMSLRFDLTVPLARYVAARQNDLVFPFRRQQISKVYRGERAQKGRFREFYQADADIVGRNTLDLNYDGEIISLIIATISELSLGDFQVNVNNRKLILGFLAAMKVMDEKEVLRILDQADKISEAKMKEELKLLRLNGLEIRKILKFAQIKGNFTDFYQELMKLDIENELFNQGIEELAKIDQVLKGLGAKEEAYVFNTAIIRGLDYYTGTIFETKLLAAPQLGSICGGGRYENLVGNFAKVKMPGVGMSIGLTRLFSQALDLGLVEINQKTISKVVILPMTDNLEQALLVAQAFRVTKIETEIYLQEASWKKKIKYADDLGVNFVVILGEDELKAKKLTVKNMKTGEQALLNLTQAIDLIKS